MPEERLPIYLTGSIASRVPPAVTKTRFPSKSCSSEITDARKLRISEVSGNRPTPLSVPVRRPVAGRITWKPRSCKSAMLATVAALFHIFGCIAGIKTLIALLARTRLVSRSSARPIAIRAIKSAVAGEIKIKSFSAASFTCLTSSTDSQTWVVTFLPDNASQVAVPTKLRAEGVGTTVTS